MTCYCSFSAEECVYLMFLVLYVYSSDSFLFGWSFKDHKIPLFTMVCYVTIIVLRMEWRSNMREHSTTTWVWFSSTVLEVDMTKSIHSFLVYDSVTTGSIGSTFHRDYLEILKPTVKIVLRRHVFSTTCSRSDTCNTYIVIHVAVL